PDRGVRALAADRAHRVRGVAEERRPVRDVGRDVAVGPAHAGEVVRELEPLAERIDEGHESGDVAPERLGPALVPLLPDPDGGEEHADDAVAGHGEREAAEEAGPERVRVQPAARDLRLELRRSRQAEGDEFDREEPEPGRDPELAAQDRVRAIVADQEPAALFERLAGPQARYADAVLAVVDDVRDLGAADQIDLSGRDRGLEDQRAGRGRIGREGREVGSPEIRLLDAEERLAAAAEDRAVDRERGLRPDPRPDAEAVERVERRALEDLRPEPSRRAGLAFQ